MSDGMVVSRLVIERTLVDDDDLVTIRSEPPGITFIEALGMLSIAESLIKADGLTEDDPS